MGKFNNKKGAIGVFLTLILGIICTMTLVFISVAKINTDSAKIDAVLDLAGRSVMGEFDRKLWEEYHLFAFYGNKRTVQDRLLYYLRINLPINRYGEFISSDSMEVDCSGNCMTNPDVFEKAILDYGMFCLKEGLLSSGLNRKTVLEPGLLQTSDAVAGVGLAVPAAEISVLPSYGQKGGSPFIGTLIWQGASILSKNSGDDFLINNYIMTQFKNRFKSCSEEDGTFTGRVLWQEVEYILFGEFSDSENQSRTIRAFVKLRTALNMAHIYGDPEKREATFLLAETLTPGPPAAATQALIVAAWALSEAENDRKLMEAGKMVALIKTKLTWATTLTQGWEGSSGSGYITPPSADGLTYEDYLYLFLFATDREARLYRTMDLIQLNLRKSYYREFLLRNHYTGFDFRFTMKGRTYGYGERY